MRATYSTDSASATGKASPMPYLRIAALETIIVDRYGERRLPDDDEGRDILRPVADHLAQIDPIRIRPWVAAWMPGLPADEVDDLIASRKAVIAECGKRALYWNSDALAHEVDLDDAARTRTKAWTIGAVDCDKAERLERRKVMRAAAARTKRAAAGATPRSQSISATKPWIKDGFATRRTWERHGKRPRVANASPATILSTPSMQVTRLRHDDHSAQAERSAAAERSDPFLSGITTDSGEAHHAKATSPIAKPLSSSIHVRRVIGREKAVALDNVSEVSASYDAVNFARLRLVAFAENAAEDPFPARWSDTILAATAEWRRAQRAVAAGETPVIASFGVDGFEPPRAQRC